MVQRKSVTCTGNVKMCFYFAAFLISTEGARWTALS